MYTIMFSKSFKIYARPTNTFHPRKEKKDDGMMEITEKNVSKIKILLKDLYYLLIR